MAKDPDPRHLTKDRNGSGIVTSIALLGAGLLIGLGIGYQLPEDPPPRVIQPSPAVARQLNSLPACKAAIERADGLAAQSDQLAEAAVHHAGLMIQLLRTIEGKPGGITPHAAFTMGAPDIKTFQEVGPAIKGLTDSYEQVKKGCQLQ